MTVGQEERLESTELLKPGYVVPLESADPPCLGVCSSVREPEGTVATYYPEDLKRIQLAEHSPPPCAGSTTQAQWTQPLAGQTPSLSGSLESVLLGPVGTEPWPPQMEVDR